MFCEDKSYAFVVVVFFFLLVIFVLLIMLSPPMKHRIWINCIDSSKAIVMLPRKLKWKQMLPRKGTWFFCSAAVSSSWSKSMTWAWPKRVSSCSSSFLCSTFNFWEKKNKILWTKCANNWTLFLLTFQSATGICVLQFWDMEDGRLKNEAPERHAPHPAAPKNLQRCLFHNTHTQTQASPWIRGPF